MMMAVLEASHSTVRSATLPLSERVRRASLIGCFEGIEALTQAKDVSMRMAITEFRDSDGNANPSLIMSRSG
jgi:hypothetical protein